MSKFTLKKHVIQHAILDVAPDTTGVIVDDEGSAITGTLSATLDFVGAGVTATDAGGGVATITIAGAGGADHGALSGLGDDDHLQYFNDIRLEIVLDGYTTDAEFSTHTGDATIHFTEASIDHGSIAGLTDDDHLQYFNSPRLETVLDGYTTDAEFTAHTGDATIHFTEASIDHGSIAGLTDDDHLQYFNTTRLEPLLDGYTTDAEFSAHTGDATIHFTEASIDHGSIAGLTDDDHLQYFNNPRIESLLDGYTTDAEFSAHTGDATIHFTEASIDHGSIAGLTDDDHLQYFNVARLDPVIDGYIASGDAAGGDLGSTYPNPTVIALTETSGPTSMVLGSVPDGYVLRRSGSTLVGAQADLQLAIFDPNMATFPISNPAAAGTRNEHPLLDFDDVTPESVVFHSLMSRDYNNGSLTIDLDWVAATATDGYVTWGVEIERIAVGGIDIDSDSFDVQQTATSTTNGTSGVVTRAIFTLTQAQADDIETGDSFRLRVQRVATDDSLVGDAQLLRISLRQ